MYSSMLVGMSCFMREFDLVLFEVDGQDLRLDDLAGAEKVGGMVEAAVGDDLADVDQALDSIRNLNEGAEVHQLGDRAFYLGADWEFALDFEPGVGECLLETERDPPLLRLDGENDGVDAVALLEHVAGMTDLFAPGHLRDMDKAFEAGFDLDEGPEVGKAGDGSGDALAGEQAFRRTVPGLGLKLLEAERDFFGFRIDFEDAELKFLADGEDVFGFGDAAMGDVADVEQSVDAAEIDERAVRHEGADGAGDGVAFLHGGVAGGGLGAGLLFKDNAAIDDDVFFGDFELGDAAVDLRCRPASPARPRLWRRCGWRA